MIEKFPFSPTKRSTSLQSTVVFSKAMIDSSIAIVSRSLSLSEYKRKFFSPKTLIESVAIVSRSLSLWEHKFEEKRTKFFSFFPCVLMRMADWNHKSCKQIDKSSIFSNSAYLPIDCTSKLPQQKKHRLIRTYWRPNLGATTRYRRRIVPRGFSLDCFPLFPRIFFWFSDVLGKKSLNKMTKLCRTSCIVW